MKNSIGLFIGIMSLAFITACAQTKVTSGRSNAETQHLEKPSRIIVYDFAGTPGDVPPDSAIASMYAQRATPQTAGEIELGRKLGRRVAEELVREIRAMNMPAERAGEGPAAQIGNGVIKGEFVSIDEGSRLKRMLIGFGAGATELKTLVEAYEVTAQGLRPLGSREITTAGGKTPGMLVPVLGGAAAGRAATAAAVSGGLNVAKELGPESIDAAAKRTAAEIANELKKAFEKRGWI